MSNAKKSIFESRGWKVGMKYLYGIGAAVVIVGALFKILHFPGANEMLIVGLGTEAVIFFFSAFEPLPHEETHYQWERVFPQLKVDDEDEELPLESIGDGDDSGLLAAGLGKVNTSLNENKLSPELFENLSESIKGLKTNVQNLAEISDVTVAANDFGSKLKNASAKLDEMNKSYGTAVEASSSFASSLTQVKEYQEQIQLATKNLNSLNAVYELELQDAQKHIASISKFFGSISNVMQNMLETSKDTDQLRQEVASLAKNMHTLNNIYGGMLGAMASAAKS
jgi:gliding motility-associated protein GldL